MVIVPELVMLAVRAPVTRMPVALSALLIVMLPALVTELLLSTMTAVPLVTVTDPAVSIRTSLGWPPFTVEVTTGVVRAVLMTVWAESFEARNGVAMVASAVPAKSKRGLSKGVLLVLLTKRRSARAAALMEI